MPHTSPPRLDLSLPKIIAGALAAASAAVASSWLGVAGTVLGTIIVSVIATVSTALYSNSLERSQHAIRETLPVLATRARQDRDPSDGPDTMELTAATSDPIRAAPSGRLGVSWPTVVVSCAATLALGFGVLTGFEALVGRSAAELTGESSSSGTTLGSLVEGGGSQQKPAHPRSPSIPTTTSPTSPTTTSPTTTGPTTTSTPTAPATTGPTTTEPPTSQPPSSEPTSTAPSGPK